jgi:hypothetical protein
MATAKLAPEEKTYQELKEELWKIPCGNCGQIKKVHLTNFRWQAKEGLCQEWTN